jgi:hypothetical protein
VALHGQPVGDLLDLLGVSRGPWPDLFEALVDEISEQDRRDRRQKAFDKLRGQ